MPEKKKTVTNFRQLTELLQQKNVCKRAAIVWPEESHTQEAVAWAAKEGFIKPLLICSEMTRKTFAAKEGFDNIVTTDGTRAALEAVRMVREKKADIIMKGFVNTDDLLRAILDKKQGILPKDTVMTHITVAKLPDYHKLLFFTDAAVIPYPTDLQRREQIKYITAFCHAFLIECPKISLIHCSEKVDARHFPYTEGYLTLKDEAEKGVFGACKIDGPLDLKTSCSSEAMRLKQIASPINGDADALLFPDIEAGNLFYKTITLFCHAETAAVLQGPLAPVVLPSRGDSIESKFYSLALASLISNNHGL
ncbi:MAG: phosphate butyryltransferase [Prevotella sp.]|nr:phosphate butyryltransferase [Prevotella sp.]